LFFKETKVSKVVFYTDKIDTPQPPRAVVERVLNHFKTNVAYWCHANEVSGFESGIDWDHLATKEGAVAVVIHDANDACVLGVSLEASDAGLATYEIFAGKLFICTALRVPGKKEILDLSA
jgi:hypothetical protein